MGGAGGRSKILAASGDGVEEPRGAGYFIACVDGLKGLPQAIETVFPKAQVQLCIVHLVRNCLNYVSWKERKTVAADLKPIYHAATSEEAQQRLATFAENWDGRYPSISQIWRRNWEQVTPFFAYPTEIRKVIYTTNAVESLNMSLRKVIKTRGSFSERRGGHETVVPGAGAGRQEMDAAGSGLEGGAEPVCDLVRRPAAKRRVGMNSGLLARGERARRFFRSPCPPLRPNRSAYGLAGRSSGQGDRGNEISGGNNKHSQGFWIRPIDPRQSTGATP